MIRIAIVDDHQIVIDGLKLLLSSNRNFEIVAEATKGSDMLQMLPDAGADLLMADVMMPDIDGCALSIQVRQQYPDIKILALSMNSEGVYIDRMIAQAHINGYLLKTTDKHELIQAIEQIVAGEDYFAPEVMRELNSFQKIKKENQLMNLTARELEIIQCIAGNMTNRQIADQLYISERTVETHRKNIFRKTDTHSVLSLLDFIKRQKIELQA